MPKERYLQRMLNQKKSSPFNYILIALCILLFLALFFDLLFIDRYFAVEISGGSMETTLYDGDIVYADRFASAKRGDIVILDVSAYRDKVIFRGDYIIKRVIATEGDYVKCEEGKVYLKKAGSDSFEVLSEPYVAFETEDFEEVFVKENEIFFMGDHRNNSVDSRMKGVGCFTTGDVVGVVPDWAIKNKDKIASWERWRMRSTKTQE